MQEMKTSKLLLIKPARFGFNIQTASSNSFQNRSEENNLNIQQKAVEEFNNVISKAKKIGLNIIFFEDTQTPAKPDAIFPNNWVSFHHDFTIIYPMQAQNRRLEKRLELIPKINQNKMIDLSYFEEKNEFLEGTGSMVFDHQNKLIYACISPRTYINPLKTVADLLNYDFLNFNAETKPGRAIYHTNVLMCVAENFVVVCLEAIPSNNDKTSLIQSFEKTNKTIIEITLDQMHQFAGNMLEVFVKGISLLIMSATAYNSLKPNQIEKLEAFSKIEIFNIPTIEYYGGGSIRCMLAEVH
jgi:hypothetical protein